MDLGLQTLISALCGAVLVPALQWLKKKFKLQGEAMRWVALLASVGFTILVLFIAGKASAADLKTVNFYLSIFGAGTNQIAYAIWKLVFEKAGEHLGGE